MHVVFLNGPSKVGKSTLALELRRRSPSRYVVMNMADPLKAGVHSLLQFSKKEIRQAERMKDRPYFLGDITWATDYPQLNAFTLRELYIKMSEDYLKPLYGKDVFGHLMAKRLVQLSEAKQKKCIIIADCGFDEEVVPILNLLSPDRCMLIRLIGEGLTYEGDSRNYIDPAPFKYFQEIVRDEGKPKKTAWDMHLSIKRFADN